MASPGGYITFRSIAYISWTEQAIQDLPQPTYDCIRFIFTRVCLASFYCELLPTRWGMLWWKAIILRKNFMRLLCRNTGSKLKNGFVTLLQTMGLWFLIQQKEAWEIDLIFWPRNLTLALGKSGWTRIIHGYFLHRAKYNWRCFVIKSTLEVLPSDLPSQ